MGLFAFMESEHLNPRVTSNSKYMYRAYGLSHFRNYLQTWAGRHPEPRNYFFSSGFLAWVINRKAPNIYFNDVDPVRQARLADGQPCGALATPSFLPRRRMPNARASSEVLDSSSESFDNRHWGGCAPLGTW